jgi:FG-GAP-like repeat
LNLPAGYAVTIVDLNHDGLDDIVAGDRGKNQTVHIFYALDDSGCHLDHRILDNGGMAGSSCVAADLNADGRLDVVCIGTTAANRKWYENLGT